MKYRSYEKSINAKKKDLDEEGENAPVEGEDLAKNRKHGYAEPPLMSNVRAFNKSLFKSVSLSKAVVGERLPTGPANIYSKKNRERLIEGAKEGAKAAWGALKNIPNIFRDRKKDDDQLPPPPKRSKGSSPWKKPRSKKSPYYLPHNIPGAPDTYEGMERQRKPSSPKSTSGSGVTKLESGGFKAPGIDKTFATEKDAINAIKEAKPERIYKPLKFDEEKHGRPTPRIVPAPVSKSLFKSSYGSKVGSPCDLGGSKGKKAPEWEEGNVSHEKPREENGQYTPPGWSAKGEDDEDKKKKKDVKKSITELRYGAQPLHGFDLHKSCAVCGRLSKSAGEKGHEGHSGCCEDCKKSMNSMRWHESHLA